MYRGSRLLWSLRDRETYNINQMIILYKPSFPSSEASYRKTELAKTAKNWLYYLIDTIICDPIKQRLLWLFFLIVYLEEDFHSVDEEEDDDDEHEDGVAAVEDVSVELAILVFNPDLIQ